MSVATGPNIVTAGLIFSYDMNNILSWRGMPVTNQFAVPAPYNSSGDVNFAVQGTTGFRRLYEGTYGGYTITNNDVVYRYDLGSNGCHYHGNSVSIPAGVYPTFTFDYYISPDATGFPTSDYLANMENYGGGAQSVGVACPNYNKGVWQTVTFSGGLTGSTGTQAMFLYPGGCGGTLATGGYILYKNPQVIFNATNGMKAPFVGPYGDRSSTQSIIDLAGTNIITAQSLTYSTTNTFSFNGSSNYMTAAGSSNWAFGQNGTIEQWVNLAGNSGTNNRFYCVNNNSSSLDAYLNGGSYNVYFHGGSVGTTSAIPNNQWVYMAVTYTSGTIAVYFNGVAQSLTGTTTGYNITNSNTLFIGQFSGGGNYYLNGRIPVMRVYNRGLTATEVAQNFAAQRSIYGV
jgi:hypothetical protein